jgi:Protein of unknown function (DUF2384)
MAQAATQLAPHLFRNVPSQDVFHFFKSGYLNGKRVVEFLGYNKKQVAEASCLTIGAIRYDQKIPEVLLERLTEWATAINLVGSFFKDEHRTMLWFQMPNPLLGGMSPRDMIRMGRFKKLLSFIQTALDENQGP